jgi:hypothetical protein
MNSYLPQNNEPQFRPKEVFTLIIVPRGRFSLYTLNPGRCPGLKYFGLSGLKKEETRNTGTITQ